MKLVLSLCTVALLAFASTGCKDNMHDDNMRRDSMGMKDACSHCPGMQTATTDGKCPVCGAKVHGM
jgi:hypothetical protein